MLVVRIIGIKYILKFSELFLSKPAKFYYFKDVEFWVCQYYCCH